MFRGVEEAAFLYEHAEILLRHTTKLRLLTVSIGLDSSCVASSLNPKMVHKQVIVRNICTKVHQLCMDLTKLYPVQILFYHIRGAYNVADLNSKIPADYDTVGIINSEVWRNGLPEFKNQDFPPTDRIFLEAREGQMVNFRQPILDNKACQCNGEYCTQITRCNCVTCNNTYILSLHNHAGFATMHSDPKPDAKKASQMPNLEGLGILQYIPTLPSHQYQDLLRRYNLVRLVRVMGRFLPKTLPRELQQALGYNHQLLSDHAT